MSAIETRREMEEVSFFFFLVLSFRFIFHKSLLFQDVSKYTLEYAVATGTLTSTESHVVRLPVSFRKCPWGWTLLGHNMSERRHKLARWAGWAQPVSGLRSEANTPGMKCQCNVIESSVLIRVFILKLLKVLMRGRLSSTVGLRNTRVVMSSTVVWGSCCILGTVTTNHSPCCPLPPLSHGACRSCRTSCACP